jgi:hypothetical protein
VKHIAKQITTQHSALEGVSVADAKCWFVKLWSSLELFGVEFLSCSNIDTKGKSLIGVSKDKVRLKHVKGVLWSPHARRGVLWLPHARRGVLWSQHARRGVMWSQHARRGVLWSQHIEGCCGRSTHVEGCCGRSTHVEG